MSAHVFNFSPGPAMLPPEVLLQVQKELLDYRGTGISVMEMSHRSAAFEDIIQRAELSLRTLMGIPEDYHVLFLQGGATGQFSMIPYNLFRHSQRADYIDTGVWSQKAIQEGSRYGQVRVIASSADRKYSYIPEITPDLFDPDADYLHLTTNNTIYGTRFASVPDTGHVPLVADMSSNILSQRYPVESFGMIYAGAQKNMGPSGVTVVIIRKDLVGHARKDTPLFMDYRIYADNRSLYNTPPTFAIYVAGLVYDWSLAQGGLDAIEERNQAKADTLYACLDQSPLFQAHIPEPSHRSWMNVTFSLPSDDLNKRFVREAEAAGLMGLAGYRSVGGMRASLYNAMPIEGVHALVAFMQAFESTV